MLSPTATQCYRAALDLGDYPVAKSGGHPTEDAARLAGWRALGTALVHGATEAQADKAFAEAYARAWPGARHG